MSVISDLQINPKTHSQMDLYAMLGLTVNSSLADARRAYKNMALMCHPDRGGNSSDMCILKTAYDWIVYQLSNVSLEGEKGTFEERETEFENFLKSQTEVKMPSLNDIEIESLGISSAYIIKIKDTITTSISKEKLDDFYFNMIYREIMFKIMKEDIDINDYNEIDIIVNTILNNFNNFNNLDNFVFHSSIPGGYGDLIDTSQTPPEIPIKDEYNFGSKELIMYKTQTACALVSSKHKQNDAYAHIPIPKKLDDYSQGNMCDYKVAYTSTIDESNKLISNYEVKNNIRTYNTLLEERNELDEYLLNNINNNINPTISLIYKDIIRSDE
jgi:hypothetical protein